MTQKIVGGIKPEGMKSVTKEIKTVSPIEVSWAWKDEPNGLITWTFKNSTEHTESFVLLRSGYYFGNAFYPVYINNKEFGVHFDVDNFSLYEDETPPLAVVYLSGKPIVCFVYTMFPDSTFSMDEGGWTDGNVPTDYKAVPISEAGISYFSIKYNPEQVTQWNEQSTTQYEGWNPNPRAFRSMKFVSLGEYISLFEDEVITPIKIENEPIFAEVLEDVSNLYRNFIQGILKLF